MLPPLSVICSRQRNLEIRILNALPIKGDRQDLTWEEKVPIAFLILEKTQYPAPISNLKEEKNAVK